MTDREKLLQILEQFLTAFDPSHVASDALIHENSLPLPLTDGIWTRIRKVHEGILVADPVTRQVVYNGVVECDDGRDILFLRLKVQADRITEIESIVMDRRSPLFMPDDLIPVDIVYAAPVPRARRSPRSDLIRVVECYIDGISLHSGDGISFHPRCDRYASGYKFTNNTKPKFPGTGGDAGESLVGLTGQAVTGLRVIGVDEELGLVAVIFMIPHAERPVPNSTYVGEIFKIVDGKIRSIEENSGIATHPAPVGFSH